MIIQKWWIIISGSHLTYYDINNTTVHRYISFWKRICYILYFLFPYDQFLVNIRLFADVHNVRQKDSRLCDPNIVTLPCICPLVKSKHSFRLPQLSMQSYRQFWCRPGASIPGLVLGEVHVIISKSGGWGHFSLTILQQCFTKDKLERWNPVSYEFWAIQNNMW